MSHRLAENTSFPSCPICSENNTKIIIDHSDFPQARIYSCWHCNHWFAHPEPEAAWLDDYYKHTYGKARSSYFGVEYDTIMCRRAASQIAFIRNQLRKSLGRSVSLSGWKVLDPGCGIGALVARLQRVSGHAVGYDSDPIAINRGRENWHANLYVGRPKELDLDWGTFDLVCLSHVVEHLSNLTDSIAYMISAVRPGGYVFVEIPNSSAEMFEKRVDTESHLHFFTRDSLMKLLTSSGLTVIACQSCGPPKNLFYDLGLSVNISVTIYDRLTRLMRNTVSLVGKAQEAFGLNHFVQTDYDGYFNRYDPPERPSGIWLRCLARRA